MPGSVADLERHELNPEFPFPGPDAYTEQDERYFHGREQEAHELLRMIDHGLVTVLFGASGLGKSSLISAGLFPLLRKRGCFPVPVRLKYSPACDLSAQVMAAVRAEAKRYGLEIEKGADPTFPRDFASRRLA